jgi:hypothetical protein
MMNKDKLRKQILPILKQYGDNEWNDLGNGHEFFKPTLYTKPLPKPDDGFGLPEEFVNQFVKEHKSDGSWKGSITTTDGKILATLTSVYSLDLIKGLVDLFDVKYEFYFGRGTSAREMSRKLKAYVDTH